MTQLLPPKKEVALALLERSNVDVYLDPRATGVIVPPQFRREPRLILKIGLNMPVPIPDLRVDEDSMSCTLSFSRTPFYCIVPWSSVFAMVGEDGRGMVWPEDVPRELAVRIVDERRQPTDRGTASPNSPNSPGSSRSLAAAAFSAGTPREPLRSAGGRTRGKPRLVEIPSASESADRNAASSASSKRGNRERNNEKKKGEGRPILMAVPASPIPIDRADAGKNEPAAASPTPDIPSDESASKRRDGAAGPRPKRELPPYLRVVK
ncbi:MAG: ClpXP protease specificity-enhancing factor SspB [Polyangiaceae bacterium]|nr:ClpXP protease specificity-enhancing factor SspB [Polyangiaceae bacterium]